MPPDHHGFYHSSGLTEMVSNQTRVVLMLGMFVKIVEAGNHDKPLDLGVIYLPTSRVLGPC